MLGVDAEVRAAQTGFGGLDAAPSTSTRSPTWWPTSRRGPAATVAGLLAYLDAAMDVENGLAPAEVTRRERPRADPHRARRQGAGVAGRRRAAPERPGVPVDGVDADLADRRRRPAAAAAR